MIPNLKPATTLDELERNVQAIRHFEEITAWVDAHRAKVLAMPIPRNTCPGCFCAIYDLAAKEGWCLDCEPRRAALESRSKA